MIIIQAGAGQDLGDVIAEVRDVAGDDYKVVTGHSGVLVDDDLALAVLAARRPARRSDTPTEAPTEQATPPAEVPTEAPKPAPTTPTPPAQPAESTTAPKASRNRARRASTSREGAK